MISKMAIVSAAKRERTTSLARKTNVKNFRHRRRGLPVGVRPLGRADQLLRLLDEMFVGVVEAPAGGLGRRCLLLQRQPTAGGSRR
jgi:hypothetical protein